MDHTYWHRQNADKPLFPDLVWSRPENRQHAGKLLIAGGNSWGFSSPAEAFSEAEKSGIGVCRILLPNAVKKIVGDIFDQAIFTPSTPSGSFAANALGDFLEQSSWADGVLLGGDFGHNSETAILLQKFTREYKGQLTLTHDAVDYFNHDATPILKRDSTTIVLTIGQLQKLAINSRFNQPFKFDMDLVQLVDALHLFSKEFKCSVVVKHNDQIVVSVDGEVSSTRMDQDIDTWRVSTAAHAAVWWLQNPNKTFEALTTSTINPS